MHKQTELAQISDEEYNHLFDPCNPSLPVRIYRFILFFLFLAPIRFLICLVGLIVYFVIVTILGSLLKYIPEKHHRAYREFGAKICRIPIRLVLLGLGIIWINNSGEIDPETRTFISNHLAFFDILLHITRVPIGCIAMAGLKNNIFVKNTARMFDICFVDRSVSAGVANQLVAWQKDKSRLPVVVFSEGKVTNGEALLGFRTGGFVSDEKVQAMCIRYKMLFTPKGMATPAWLEWNFPLYVYQLFSIPLMIVDIDVLPVLDLAGKDVKERAKMVQLQMANHFGCLAIEATNKKIFQSEEKPKAE